MRSRVFCRLLLVLASLTLTIGSAVAHPHVWVTMKSELIYAADGTITGVRHAWAFDDMYSAFAVQDLAGKQKDTYTREELAPLAEVNVTSLKEFSYFTFAKVNGKKAAFADPKEYYLDYRNSVLTLHFVLPFATPVKAKALDLQIFDPSYFVDFSFDDNDAVTLVDAPAGCKFSVLRPANATSQASTLGEAFFSRPDAWNFGAAFANKIFVKCP
ncbi:MAG TPA: DUF1007 family protein [Xanthobacteraceae bacterium]|jgi:ABC-type uncharacterized transport system substrate-binding protein